MKPNPKNIVLMVALAAATQSQAQTWTGTTNQAWTTTTNWSTGTLPGVNTKTYIDTATGNTPIITTAVNKSATVGGNDLWIGSASGKSGVLTVDNGGALNSNGTWLVVGNSGGTGTLNVNAGGSVSTNNNIRMAQGGGSGTLNVNGGTVTASHIEAQGTSAFNVTNGGTISVTAGDLKMRNSTSTISGTSSSITTSSEIFIGVGGGAATLNMSGGALQTGEWMVIGINAGVSGTLNMSGGTVTAAATNAGAFSTIGAGGGTGTVNLSGGTYNDMQKTILGENAGGTGNFNLSGTGVLHTKRIEVGAGAGNISFNGGTLRARQNDVDFIDSVATTTLNAGGGTIDSNGFDITIADNIVGAGALTKIGTGKLTLSSANSYTGATTVNAGNLVVNGAITSAITANSGATFSGTGSTTGSLTLNGGSVLSVNTTTEFTANGVNFAGSTEMIFESALTPTSTYDVVTYGAGGLSGFANIVQTSRGLLVNDTANSKVTFTAGSVLTDTWNTVSGNWQVGSATNWGNGDDSLFWNSDAVVFDDTPGADSTATLVGNLFPSSVSVSGSTNHTFLGAGAITGTGSVTKSGTGTLTINTANSYSGGTTISAGKIIAGNAAAFGSGTVALGGSTLELGNVTVANAIVASGLNTLDGTGTLSGAISGAGSFIKVGSGAVTLTGANTFGGGFAINAGTVNVANIGNLGGAAANVTMHDGALNWTGTLDFQSGASYTQAGGAANSAGEFWVGGTGAGTMNMSGGSLSTGSWFVVGRNGTGVLNMFGGNISSSSSNANSFAVLGSFGGSSGTANISGGTLASSQDFYVGESGAGILNISGTGAVTASDGVRLGVATGGSGVVNLDGGSISTNLVTKGAGTGTFNFNGGTLKATANNATFITGVTTDVKSGGAKIDSNGFNVTSVVDLTGAGSLEKLGAGSLTLSGAGNSVSSVAVSAGTLFVTGQLSAASGVAVADGATIGGNGTVNGNIVIADGGMIDFSLGALAVNSSSTVSFGGFTLDDVIGFDKNSAAEGTYTILSGSFTLNSSNIANFGLENAYTRGDGKQVYFQQGSLNIVVAVPETSTLVLGLAGSLLLLRRRRN